MRKTSPKPTHTRSCSKRMPTNHYTPLFSLLQKSMKHTTFSGQLFVQSTHITPNTTVCIVWCSGGGRIDGRWERSRGAVEISDHIWEGECAYALHIISYHIISYHIHQTNNQINATINQTNECNKQHKQNTNKQTNKQHKQNKTKNSKTAKHTTQTQPNTTQKQTKHQSPAERKGAVSSAPTSDSNHQRFLRFIFHKPPHTLSQTTIQMRR